MQNKMGRAPCCSKQGLQRGPWKPQEDTLLIQYIKSNGEGHWSSLPKKAGLLRCGKSCRLRWMNYLRPDIKLGNITPDEEDLIVRLHGLLGNRWSLIARRLPGRTDNEIKNYWNTYLRNRIKNTRPSATAKKAKRQRSGRKRSSKYVAAEAKKSVGPDVRADSVEEATPFSIPTGSFCHIDGDHKQQDVCPKSSEVPDFYVSVCDEMNDDSDFREIFVCTSVTKDYGFVQDDEGQVSEAAAERVTLPWKIYEEYQQLLKEGDQDPMQLDSFVDSSLI